MIKIEQIRNFFPSQIRGNSSFDKRILKEYLQLMILDYLSSTPSIRKMAFIGRLYGVIFIFQNYYSIWG